MRCEPENHSEPQLQRLRVSPGGSCRITLLALGVGSGVLAYGRLSTDVFPDLTVPVFNVITQNEAMAPQELELGVTLPVETALNGLPGVMRVRSVTQLGVSQVTVEFAGDVDYWQARQLVSERLTQVQRELPAGTRAPLVSSLTNRLNEVYEYLVEGDADPMTLRDIAEFDRRYRMLSVPGVASVERLGGQLRQYQVLLDAIVNGTRAITTDTALRLGKYFGTSPEIWLDLQSDYDLRVARQTRWKTIDLLVRTRVA